MVGNLLTSELQKALAGLWTAAEACDGGHCPVFLTVGTGPVLTTSLPPSKSQRLSDFCAKGNWQKDPLFSVFCIINSNATLLSAHNMCTEWFVWVGLGLRPSHLVSVFDPLGR